jgi:hypothetical protein
MLEAAIVTPLLLLLTFSIVDFGAAFWVYLALENGVSQATRYAVTGQQVSGLTRAESIRQAMRTATPNLTIDDGDFTFEYMRPGTAVWLSGTGAEGDIGKVTINYTWTFFTPLMRAFFDGGSLEMKVASAMLNERRFTE